MLDKTINVVKFGRAMFREATVGPSTAEGSRQLVRGQPPASPRLPQAVPGYYTVGLPWGEVIHLTPVDRS